MLAGESNAFVTKLVLTVVPVLPPTNLKGFHVCNRFLTQIDFVNILTWQPPTNKNVVEYRIYRDPHLTQLIATVSANHKLEFKDYNRKKGVNYTYYVVSVDDLGNISSAVSVTITSSCCDKK